MTGTAAAATVMPTDATLVKRAQRGDGAAFAELYRRHAQPAWRLAQAITRDSHDAADTVSEAFTRVFGAMRRGTYSPDAPFRLYLLTATRNAAIDGLRRSGRVIVAGEAASVDRPTGDREPSEVLTDATEAMFVGEAFRTLPERWRSVLWLTEVEGLAARDAAPCVGLSANSTAQLAVRARAGLRERYLRAHLRATDQRDCRRTIDHLGAYVDGGLAARDIAKVDQHLAGCAPCRARLAELEDVGSSLRRILIPLPPGLAAASMAKWVTWQTSAAAGGSRLAVLPRTMQPWADKVVAGAAAAVFTLGVAAATIIGSGSSNGGRGPAGEAALSPPQLDKTTSSPPVVSTYVPVSSSAPTASSSPRRTASATGSGGTSDGARGATSGSGSDSGSSTPSAPAPSPSPTTPPAPEENATDDPALQVDVGTAAGDTDLGVSVGSGDGSCTGLVVGSTDVGCTPDPGDDDVVSADGTLLPPIQSP